MSNPSKCSEETRALYKERAKQRKYMRKFIKTQDHLTNWLRYRASRGDYVWSDLVEEHRKYLGGRKVT